MSLKLYLNVRTWDVLWVLCLISNFAYAQVYEFKTYTEDHGLPQAYVYAISQAENGFLHLSTGEGFVAFGGNKFKTFTTRNGMAENFVNCHFIDSRGYTWLGHFQNGVTVLKDLVFTKIASTETLNSKVTGFTEDKQGNIWFVVQGLGIYYIDTSLTLRKPSFDPDLGVNSVCVDAAGKLLCGTEGGMLLFDIEKAEKPVLLCDLAELKGMNVTHIVKDTRAGNILWAAVPGTGIIGIIAQSTCYRAAFHISSELGAKTDDILSIYSDRSAVLWVSIADEGIKRISFPDSVSRAAFSVSSIGTVNGLGNLHVKSIFEDFEGNMWFGTFGGGLIQMKKRRFSYFQPGPAKDIRSILIDNAGNFWLGTEKGLLLFDPAKGTGTGLFDEKNGFVRDQVNVVFMDSRGLLWLGTAQNGIFTMNVKDRTFTNFSREHKLKVLTINCIAEDGNGIMYIGSQDGVYIHDPVKSTTQHLTTVEGLLHNNVLHILCDSRKRIWFSSNGTPPYYREGFEFTILKDIPGLKSFNLNSVTEDKQGMIWISTEGDGLFRYDGRETKNYRVENGLVSNFCYAVKSDGNNDLWVSHKNGLSCIRKSGNVIGYDKTDGVLFTEHNLNAINTDVTGNVWFGTSDGISMYHAGMSRIRSTRPRINILQMTLNDTVYTTRDHIELSYGQYSARLDYIGISLTDPAKVNYQYRLLGLDSVWRSTGERFVEFPGLTDGNYTFQVIACNADGEWNLQPAEIIFSIAKPFWKKPWFWSLIVIFFGLCSYLVIRMRTRNLIKAKMILEQKVEEKTAQLREEKEHVEHVKGLLEEKDKDITASILYAKRIQEALLPAKESLYNCFPESFIYYKPRDIVSGDFYWFAETEDSYIVAVVDCTGHGIPGAFMSLIGSKLLDEIVINRRITQPSEILSELDVEIVRTLKQSSQRVSTSDGMDIALCALNKTKTKMSFASASRPMYFVRNGLLTEVNLKTFSIGGAYKGISKAYGDMEMDLLPGDTFYLFSDGYSDQFDRDDLKKFGTRQLKQLMTTIARDPVESQYDEIDSAFLEWKGDQKQIDDVTIIGIKL